MNETIRRKLRPEFLKIMAILLTACIIAMGLLLPVLSSVHSGYDCEKETCPICILIGDVAKKLSSPNALSQICLLAPPVVFTLLLLLALYEAPRIASLSLISAKVKLTC